MSCKPDTETTAKMYSLYTAGESLSAVGEAFGVSRQTVFMRFKRAGKPMRTTTKKAVVNFNGATYTERANGYLAKTDGARELLHRDVWEYYHGEIPPSHDIHHKDGCKTNNDIENLLLIHKAEHTKLHGLKNNQYTKKRGTECHV